MDRNVKVNNSIFEDLHAYKIQFSHRLGTKEETKRKKKQEK